MFSRETPTCLLVIRVIFAITEVNSSTILLLSLMGGVRCSLHTQPSHRHSFSRFCCRERDVFMSISLSVIDITFFNSFFSLSFFPLFLPSFSVPIPIPFSYLFLFSYFVILLFCLFLSFASCLPWVLSAL